jgi:co-chaperonin GroES (HSP10)
MLSPRGLRLLVKRLEAPKPESQLIEIPETIAAEESVYALVLAVSDKISEEIVVADTVILAKYSGSPVTVDLDGEQIDALIVMLDDVLAVVEE